MVNDSGNFAFDILIISDSYGGHGRKYDGHRTEDNARGLA